MINYGISKIMQLVDTSIVEVVDLSLGKLNLYLFNLNYS